MTQSNICLIVIRSKDIDRAKSFYQLFGLVFEKHQHGNGLIHLAASLGDTVFEIYPLRETDLPTTSVRLGFSVESCDAVTQALLEAGYVVRSHPKDSPWGRVAVVEDYDGHKVEIAQKS